MEGRVPKRPAFLQISALLILMLCPADQSALKKTAFVAGWQKEDERGFSAKSYAEMAKLLPERSKNSVRDRLRTIGMLP